MNQRGEMDGCIPASQDGVIVEIEVDIENESIKYTLHHDGKEDVYHQKCVNPEELRNKDIYPVFAMHGPDAHIEILEN